MMRYVTEVNVFFFQAEDGIRDAQESRGLGDVYKRQAVVDGISPALSAAILVMPYFFVPEISMQWAFYALSLIHI